MADLNHASSGYITIINHASSSDPILWLFSVFGGIIMCKTAYELMGVFSPLIFEDLFDERGQKESIINRTSPSSDIILGISIGYFLSDLAMIIWTYPTLGGLEYVLHHGLSMLAIGQSVLSGQAQFYIFMVLFTEITTPFVNLRWYLDVAGKKNSTLYLSNGVAMVVGWLVARVVLFVFFFYHLFMHFDQVKQMYPTGFYSMLTIPPALAMMNLFWFWKIAKGLIKTLTKLRRGHAHSS
ncbi:TRAM/LAG1/CLN8 homology domain-containing protein [Cynara cardunculus var. scolymus]|uniref:TRAM/LAG1/CLN8 homology domain-containing protein n=1 Tax=Cynara cardunculus var. scolymus TaxID=59895 RepID=A0A103Y759_CYNCS|nr:TRAM/LAG1/CLN8 homology domain-containing protein [Cynara cardunculus var. scolymus]